MNDCIRNERILVTVMTYPTVSRKYGENVCTAGLRADGTWIRLYPVPFQQLAKEDRFRLFDWIECRTVKRRRDRRQESFSIYDIAELRRKDHMGVDDQWKERRLLVLGEGLVHRSFEAIRLRPAQQNISLATFKPCRVIRFHHKKNYRSYRKKEQECRKVDYFKAGAGQLSLYGDNRWKQAVEWSPKLPYRFYYDFTDCDGTKKSFAVYDFELGKYFWKCMDECGNVEKLALEKVSDRYNNTIPQSDVHFILGTDHRLHFAKKKKGNGKKRNPWMIVGVLPIPHVA